MITTGQFSHADEAQFHPVIIGGDTGAYSLARSFNEGWGVTSTLVSANYLGPIRYSRILDVEFYDDRETGEGDMPPSIAATLALAPKLQEKHPGKKLLLTANTDSKVWDIIANRDALEPYYTFIFPSQEQLISSNSKIEFPQLADKYGLSVPPTTVIDFAEGVDAVHQQLREDIDYDFDWVLKPAGSQVYETLHWPGKKKVYFVSSDEELASTLATIHEHTDGYPDAQKFVVQPRLIGNDTYNMVLTAYMDSHGEVTMLSSAQVLLEDHSPTAVGNPAAMISEPYPHLYDQVVSFLKGLDWRGYANFDLKVDQRTGTAYFFEINPRIGRSSYYSTAAGMNPLQFMVQDIIDGKRVPQMRVTRAALTTFLPKRLVMRYVDKRLKAKIRLLSRRHRVFYPMINRREHNLSLRGIKRLAYTWLSTQKHWLKFHRNYPVAKLREQGAQSFDTSTMH